MKMTVNIMLFLIFKFCKIFHFEYTDKLLSADLFTLTKEIHETFF